MSEQQGRTITPGEVLGRFLGYAGGWLSKLPELFQAMNRPYATTALALEALLVAKGRRQ